MRNSLFVVVAIGALLLGSDSQAEQSVRILSVNGESTPTGDLYTLDQNLVIEWVATDDSGCGGVAPGELFVWIDGFNVQSVDPTDPAENFGDRFGGVFTVDATKIPDPDESGYGDPVKFFHFGCSHGIKLQATMYQYYSPVFETCLGSSYPHSALSPFWTTLKKECDGGSSCDSAGGKETVGESVDVATGAVHHAVTDFVIPGPLPIEFTRRYDSNSTHNGALGFGWQHSYEIRLERAEHIRPGADPIASRKIVFIDGNGHRTFFTKDQQASPTSWHGDATETLELEQEPGSTWLVSDKHGMKYEFYDFGPSGEIRVARLKSIEDRKGNTVTFGYTSGQLTTVTDTSGRVLTFHYDGDHLASIALNGSTVAGYTVSNGDLTFVGTPNGVQSYEFAADVQELPHKLITVRDGEFRTIESHEYDAETKRVTHTESGGGYNAYAIVYDSPNQTTVTNEATVPVSTVYTIDPFTGFVTDRAGDPSCGSCGAPGDRTIKEFDSHQNLRRVTDARGVITDMTYDARGNLLTRTAAVGTALERTTTYTYTSDEFNQIETISVPTLGLLGCATSHPSKLVTVSYFPNGALKDTTTTGCNGTEAFEHITAYTYDGHGQVLTIDGPRDNENDANDVTVYAYYEDAFGDDENESDVNKRGRLHTMTNALRHITTFNEYDGLGHALSVTDPNGVETRYTYDSAAGADLLHEVVVGANSSVPATTEYLYDYAGSVTWIWNPECYANWDNGDGCPHSFGYEYDAGGKLHATQDSMGNKIVNSYDAEGNRTREEFRDATPETPATTRFTNFDYDAFNRLRYTYFSAEAPEDEASSFYKYTYNEDGTRHTERDPEGHVTAFTYDELKRMTSVAQTVGSETLTTYYEYDSQDNLIKVTDPKGLVTQYAFGDASWRLATSSPDTGKTSYGYDPAGNLLTTTNYMGVTETRGYDALNRLTTTTYPDSELTVANSYDSEDVSFGKGRRTGLTDRLGETTVEYDHRGLLTSEQKTIKGRTYVTGYDYDLNGALTAIRYPSTDSAARQGVVNYLHDYAERVELVTAAIGDQTITVADNFAYEPFGPRSNLAFGNGLAEARSFDTRYQPDTFTLAAPTPETLLSYTHHFDKDGNLDTRTDNLASTNNRTFDYDEIHRLTEATGPWCTGAACTSCTGKTYTYDKNGNRLCKGESGAATNYTSTSGTNRLASSSGGEAAAYTYDGNGSITADGTHTFDYSDAGRLATVDDAETASYLYDGENRRAEKTVDRVPTYYFYDPSGRLLTELTMGETEGSGTGKDYVYLHGAPVARVDWSVSDGLGDACPPWGPVSCEPSVTRVVAEELFYYHTDHLGTPIAMTDDNGSIVWQAEPRPFGDILESLTHADIENNVRFPGQYFDSETGLHQNWFRDYDPKTGRYGEADPIGLAGGIDPYDYVHGNPPNNTDTTGLINDNAANLMTPAQVRDSGQRACARARFLQNYWDMRRANWKNSDRYFHCKANCEAVRCGGGGQKEACDISDTREMLDQLFGAPASASVADNAANAAGQSGATTNPNQSCQLVCALYRPPGLPSQY